MPRLLDEAAGIGARIAKHSAGDSLAFSGVWGGVRGVLAAPLTRSTPNILMLLAQAGDGDIVAGDAVAFGLADSVSLPLSASELSASSISDDDFAERLQVLQRLSRRQPDADTPMLVTAFIGGAMILPSSLSVINAVFVGKSRAVAFAVWGGTIGGMSVIGLISPRTMETTSVTSDSSSGFPRRASSIRIERIGVGATAPNATRYSSPG